MSEVILLAEQTVFRSRGPPFYDKVFAKLATLLRKAGARTVEGVSDAIAKVPADYTPTECADDLATSGYRSTCMQNAANFLSRFPCPTKPVDTGL